MSTAYDRPDIYDLDTCDFEIDIPFYKKIAEEACISKNDWILELACGTGRVTIPMAKDGFKIIGVDESYPMIVASKKKVKDADSVWKPNLIVGNMINFLCQKNFFNFIFVPFNSFQQILTLHEQISCLRNICHMLKPNGYFVADLTIPTLLKGKIISEISKSRPLHNILLTRRMVSEVNTATQIVTRKFYYQLFELDNNRRLIEQLWVPRNYCNIYPLQWEHMLISSGFSIEEKYGDFEQNPFSSNSQRMLFLCKKNC